MSDVRTCYPVHSNSAVVTLVLIGSYIRLHKSSHIVPLNRFNERIRNKVSRKVCDFRQKCMTIRILRMPLRILCKILHNLYMIVQYVPLDVHENKTKSRRVSLRRSKNVL